LARKNPSDSLWPRSRMKWSWAGLHCLTVRRGIHRQHSPHRLHTPARGVDLEGFM
jgi:hypothetical protein